MSVDMPKMLPLEAAAPGCATEADRILDLMRKDTELVMRSALKNMETTMSASLEAMLQACAQTCADRLGAPLEVPKLVQSIENPSRQEEDEEEAVHKGADSRLSCEKSSQKAGNEVLTPMVAAGGPDRLVTFGNLSPVVDGEEEENKYEDCEEVPKDEEEKAANIVVSEEEKTTQPATQGNIDAFIAECGLKDLNSVGHGEDGISTNWNALHFAIAKGRCDIAADLCDNDNFHGVNAVTSNGTSALLAAIGLHSNDATMMKIVLGCDRYCNFNQPNDKMLVPLHAATSMGHVEMLEALVKHPGVDFNVRNPLGSTALHVSRSCDAVRLCLSRMEESTVNATNNMGQTALHIATSKDAAEALLQHKNFKVANARDASGRTALHCAVLHNLPDIVTVLLNHPKAFKEANAQDHRGRTALHFAVMKSGVQRMPLLQALLPEYLFETDNVYTWSSQVSFLDCTVKDKCGKTALAHALEKDEECKDAVAFFENMGKVMKFWRVMQDRIVSPGRPSSPEMPERLVAGATLRELRREGTRLHFLKISGEGPAIGWVNAAKNALVKLTLT